MSIQGTGHPVLDQFNKSCLILQAPTVSKETIAADPLLSQLKRMEWPTGGSGASTHIVDSYWVQRCNTQGESLRLHFFLVGIVLNLNSRAYTPKWERSTMEESVKKVSTDPEVLVTRVKCLKEECFVALRRSTNQIFTLAFDSGKIIYTAPPKPPESTIYFALPLARRFLSAVQAIEADEQEACKVALATHLSGAPYLLVLEYAPLPGLLHI